jgi:hypothetical protein
MFVLLNAVSKAVKHHQFCKKASEGFAGEVRHKITVRYIWVAKATAPSLSSKVVYRKGLYLHNELHTIANP